MSLYLTEHGIEHERVFLDTGWEHDLTYEYLREDLPRALGEGSPFFLGGTEAAGSEAEGQAEAKRPAASVCDMGQAVTWFETPRLDSSRLAEGGSNGVTRRARALRDTSRWNG